LSPLSDGTFRNGRQAAVARDAVDLLDAQEAPAAFADAVLAVGGGAA
jgi:hypothetical protein